MEKVAIVGSRKLSSSGLERVSTYVLSLPLTTIVVTGGALGVDQAAEAAAMRRGLVVKVFLPDWKKHGKAAGPIRNSEIVAYADRGVAFWDGKSRGTLDTITKFGAVEKPIEVNVIE